MTNGTSGASAPHSKTRARPKSSGVALSYLKIRDVTTKDEEANGASTYVAVLPAAEILKIGTDGNLRSYIPEHEGKKRNLVHKAIARTITDMPDRFSQLNSGFLVGASKIAVDDKEKIVTLYHPSVNNGAQSQGEIKRYLERCVEQGEEPVDFAVRCEFSIEPDTSVRTTIAVARNTTTKIEGISIAGKHGYFDHLIPSFKKEHPGLELATSETDVEEKYVDTRLLLQVLWAMMPDELVPEHRRSTEARMRAYKNAAYCLQDFVNIVDRRDLDEDDAERFRYFVEMAGEAWREYLRWHAHEEWNDKRLREPLRQVVRGDEGIIKVSDGIIFPILSALSEFVKKRGGFRTTVSGPGGVQRTVDAPRWQIVYPKVFHDEDMLIAARRQLIQCGGRPMLMGRSGGAYEALMTLTEMAERYSQAAAS